MSAKSIKATEKVRIMLSKTTGLRQPTILLDFLGQKVRLADIMRSERQKLFLLPKGKHFPIRVVLECNFISQMKCRVPEKLRGCSYFFRACSEAKKVRCNAMESFNAWH
ncbi:hypothetical protein CMO93_01620 [Candidatus Woesearchaeota archaeon]|nr:hypothetical protein [Candidatus Woesearchaeota archaeon]